MSTSHFLTIACALSRFPWHYRHAHLPPSSCRCQPCWNCWKLEKPGTHAVTLRVEPVHLKCSLQHPKPIKKKSRSKKKFQIISFLFFQRYFFLVFCCWEYAVGPKSRLNKFSELIRYRMSFATYVIRLHLCDSRRMTFETNIIRVKWNSIGACDEGMSYSANH